MFCINRNHKQTGKKTIDDERESEANYTAADHCRSSTNAVLNACHCRTYI